MNFEAISMEAAVALTGLSKRTLWRRLAEGLLQKLPAAGGGGGRSGLSITAGWPAPASN